MHQDFNALLNGYLTGSLSEADEQQFLDMIGEPEHRALLEAEIDRLAAERSLVGEGQEALQAASLLRLQSRLGMGEEIPVTKVRRMPWRYAAAAAVVLAVAATVWMMVPGGKDTSERIAVKSEIPKVEGAATLQLPDGSVMSLDSIAPDPALASKAKEYSVFGEDSVQQQEIASYTIQTTRGRQFQLLLEDGTKVWLNASSSIKFPTAFRQGLREVEISGEVYFEVAKNAQAPFRVKVGDEMRVDVLGTHFNIKAYNDEQRITTSLLEGAVRVTSKGEQLVMKPGQQVTAASGNTLQLSDAEVSEAVAWKEGRFELYGNIRDIMRQLQRWYDISAVEYGEGVDNTTLVATISSSKKLSEVLDLLEKTGSIHFDIEGTKVIVKSTAK